MSDFRTTRLTPLLAELEDVMTSLGAPFARYAAPGISDEEIDALIAPKGIALPTELREWWRWHHGMSVVREDVLEAGAEIGPGSTLPMSVPEALRDAAATYALVPARAGGVGGWEQDWLPFAEREAHGGRLVARLGESAADEVCVGWWYLFDAPPAEPIASSIAEIVDSWLLALRQGVVVWRGGWYFEDSRSDLPRHVYG